MTSVPSIDELWKMYTADADQQDASGLSAALVLRENETEFRTRVTRMNDEQRLRYCHILQPTPQQNNFHRRDILKMAGMTSAASFLNGNLATLAPVSPNPSALVRASVDASVEAILGTFHGMGAATDAAAAYRGFQTLQPTGQAAMQAEMASEGMLKPNEPLTHSTWKRLIHKQRSIQRGAKVQQKASALVSDPLQEPNLMHQPFEWYEG